MAENTTFIDNRVISLLFKGTVSNEQANAVQLPVLLQPDGTLRTWGLTVGLDPDNRERIVLTDSNRMLRVRPFENYRQTTITDIGNAWTTVVANTTADTIIEVEVEVWKYATNVTTSGLDIRFNDGAGATPTIVDGLLIQTQQIGIRLGPYHLGNGWSIQMLTINAGNCRCVATWREYGIDNV